MAQLGQLHFAASIELIKASLEALAARAFEGDLFSTLNSPDATFIGQLERDWQVNFQSSITFSLLSLVSLPFSSSHLDSDRFDHAGITFSS